MIVLRVAFASFVVFSAALASRAFEPGDLRRMGELSGEEYLRARDRIVTEGQASVSGLLFIADDEAADWHLRLAAGTCVERILHGREIDELDHHDWSSDPVCGGAWRNGTILANLWNEEFTPLFLERIREAGFWFHYLEFCAGKIDAAGLEPSFKFIPSFIYANATGGIRYLAARIVDEQVEEAFRCNRIPDLIPYEHLKVCITNGTYPEGVKTMISGITAKRQMAGYRLSKYLKWVTDAEFLRGVASKLPEGNGNRVLIEGRIRILQQSGEIDSGPCGDTSFRLSDSLLPEGRLCVPSSMSRITIGTELGEDESERTNAERLSRRTFSSIVLVCVVVGLATLCFVVARKLR